MIRNLISSLAVLFSELGFTAQAEPVVVEVQAQDQV